MNVTASDDTSKYTCQATNEAIQRSILDSIILNIFYKPVFEISDSKVFEVKENESIVIDVTAKANPEKVTYRWTKDNDTVWEGPVLNITSAERSQTGTYSCEAKNDVGESVITIVLKVLYPAIIFKKGDESENMIVAEPGTIVKLECRGDGYPLPNNALKWKRDNFDMTGRTETLTPSFGRSILIVKNVTRDASGEFTCIADNGVGKSDTWKILLLVKHEPIIKDSETYKSVLSDRGKSAQLYCKAEGIPDVSFSWSFEGAIVSHGNDRMTNEVAKLDYLTWQGNLTIADVNVKDFGEYKCIARNEIGFATTEVNLLP
ncbi:Nephrin, partial [Stegodyphus mimosarum]